MVAPSVEPRLAPPPPARPLELRRAWRALRTLVAEPSRTEQVFELFTAVGGAGGEKLFQRCARDPIGRRLLAEKPSLLARLGETEALQRLPEGSLGREYARFMREGNIAAAGLVDAANAVPRDRPADAERRFFFDRLRDMHDLWHVVTGYGRDVAGEAALLAFSHAQTRNRGFGVLTLTAGWLGPKDRTLSWQRYLLRAWRRGRGAVVLATAPWEELLPLPLPEVRRRLAIEPPEVAHPGGVIVTEAGPTAAPAS